MYKVILKYLLLGASSFIVINCGNNNSNKSAKGKQTSDSIIEVKIGAQVWMSKNLDVEKFRNGDPIPEVKTDDEWEAAGKNGQPACCYYENDPANGEKYGRLYNWYAVNDPRGLAPVDYHIPTDAEWTILTTNLGGPVMAVGKMRSTSGWERDDGEGSNSSGFSGLPGGIRNYNGKFARRGFSGYWWSISEGNRGDAWVRCLSLWDKRGKRRLPLRFFAPKKQGYSVRCIKD